MGDKFKTEIEKFWEEIEHLSYASAVWDYKYNDFKKILNKYKLKRSCSGCRRGF